MNSKEKCMNSFASTRQGENLFISIIYSVFHQFRQAKFAYDGSILSSSQFLLLPQPPRKVELASKVVKVDSKIIFSLPEI
jgi:hypothetical protein